MDLELGVERLVDPSKPTGADQLLTQGVMNLSWNYSASQQESDISYEKQHTQVGYIEDGSFDYHTIHKKSKKEFDEPVPNPIRDAKGDIDPTKLKDKGLTADDEEDKPVNTETKTKVTPSKVKVKKKVN